VGLQGPAGSCTDLTSPRLVAPTTDITEYITTLLVESRLGIPRSVWNGRQHLRNPSSPATRRTWRVRSHHPQMRFIRPALEPSFRRRLVGFSSTLTTWRTFEIPWLHLMLLHYETSSCVNRRHRKIGLCPQRGDRTATLLATAR